MFDYIERISNSVSNTSASLLSFIF